MQMIQFTSLIHMLCVCARSGNLAVLQYLVEKGADLSSVTNAKQTALQTARKSLKSNHPALLYLEKMQTLHSDDQLNH